MIVLSLDMPAKHAGGYALFTDSGKHTHLKLGPIRFEPTRSEAEDYQALATLLDRSHPTQVVLEWPFLHSIAGFIGGVKMLCAVHHIPWSMLRANTSKKQVLGRGNATKLEVFQWACKHPLAKQFLEAHPQHILSQHEADSLLYLVCWLKQQGDSYGHDCSINAS